MCTETKDARVHCTILNDHTNRGRTPPTGEAGPDRPSETTPPTHGVVLSGPNSVPPALPTTEKTGLSGVSTFLEQPPPTPAPAIKTTHGEVLGPSTTPPQRAEHSPADTTAGEVFGEAP